jgi:hypothetical protein
VSVFRTVHCGGCGDPTYDRIKLVPRFVGPITASAYW